MTNANRTARTIIGMTLLGMSLLTATAVKAQDFDPVSGAFHSNLDSGPSCLSPVHICTNGTLTGDISGTYHFQMDTLIPDKNNPAVSYFVGHTVITVPLQNGAAYIYSHDVGQLTFQSPTQATIVNGIGIYNGTQTYAGAIGFLLATGSIDFVTGVGAGPYNGTLYIP